MSDEHKIIHRINTLFLLKKVFCDFIEILKFQVKKKKKKTHICKMEERVVEGGYPFTIPNTQNGLLGTDSCKTQIAKGLVDDDSLTKKCLSIK